MPSDPKPRALTDLRKGIGLLYRAAKTTLEKLPTGELEEAVRTSAKEMGRALENVTQTVTRTVEKEIFGRGRAEASAPAAPPAPTKDQAPPKAEAVPHDASDKRG